MGTTVRSRATPACSSVSTATQAELGGPGGSSNPEELFSAALANCFTSTLTGMARSRGIPLGDIETSVRTQLDWGEGGDHHLSSADLHTRVSSPAAEADVRKLIADAERTARSARRSPARSTCG